VVWKQNLEEKCWRLSAEMTLMSVNGLTRFNIFDNIEIIYMFINVCFKIKLTHMYKGVGRRPR
jgi:hypothetical protein